MKASFIIMIFAAAVFQSAAQTNMPVVTNSIQVPVADIGERAVILGYLGRPIGEEVTIHGHTQSPSMLNGGASFLVDTLDGRKLEHPIGLEVLGISKWPTNTEATIQGYEAGDIRFEHNDDENWGGAYDTRFKTHQVIWLHFEGVDVEPASLKLESIGDVGEQLDVKTHK